MSPTEKHPLFWYNDNMQSIPMPGGMRELLCPFGDFSLDSHSFQRDLEILTHIEEKHSENVQNIWEKFHRPELKQEQKTLEGFQ